MMSAASPPARRANTLAVASLVLAIAGVATCGLTSIVAIVLGVVARSRLDGRDEHGAGLALAAIVVGCVVSAISLIAILGLLTYADQCGSGC